MNHRPLLTAATLAAATIFAGCGADHDTDARRDTPPPTSTAPVTHPTGADDLVVRVDLGVGGFLSPTAQFAEIPAVIVTGDGTMIRPGPQIEIFPGPLLPALESSQLTAGEVEAVLGAAGRDGLLTTPAADYDSARPNVTDIGWTVLRLATSDTTIEHRAFALGLEDGTGPAEAVAARRRLGGFVSLISADISALIGRQPDTQVYTPQRWAFAVTPVDVGVYGEPQPTVLPWPSVLGTPPAPGTCVELPSGVVEATFATATQLTFYSAGGTIYAPLLRALLPGSTPC